MHQLPRAAQQLLTLRAAELVRRHGADEAVAGRAGIALLDLLPPLGQCGALRPQPTQHAPDRAVVQTTLIGGGRSRRRLITGSLPYGDGRLTVGLSVVLHVAGRLMEKRRAGIALVGEYESRDNR